jgi:hypothetical protein
MSNMKIPLRRFHGIEAIEAIEAIAGMAAASIGYLSRRNGSCRMSVCMPCSHACRTRMPISIADMRAALLRA